jgi:hypothetical protein
MLKLTRPTERDVVAAGELPDSLEPTVRRLPHRDEQAGVSDV